MKLFRTILPFICLLLLASCGEDCELTGLEEIIVGRWEVKSLGQTSGEVEFLADGTLLDPDDALFGILEEMDDKTYTIQGDQTISCMAEGGGTTLTFEFAVLSYDCDKITIDILFGITGELNRL